MRIWKGWKSGARGLVVIGLTVALASCASNPRAADDTDGEDRGFLGLGGEHHRETRNTAWMQDAPHSEAIEPSNWLSYSAFYLGEIALAPFRLIGLILEGG